MWLYKAPGVLGAGVVALAAYLATQALANDRVQAWTRARAAAESLKSGIFLYRASAPPFDGADRTAQLVSRVQKVSEDMKGAETRPSDDKPAPPGQLTVNQYISERVDDQVNWYEKRAKEHLGKADLCRKATAALGGISALLALATAAAAVSAWAAVIATITASITAHLKNRQYLTLAATYQATGLRLRLIESEWAGSGKTEADKAERNSFIQRCEDTMAARTVGGRGFGRKKTTLRRPEGAGRPERKPSAGISPGGQVSASRVLRPTGPPLHSAVQTAQGNRAPLMFWSRSSTRRRRRTLRS